MAIIVSDRREPPPLEALSDIYIDESSQTKNRYLLIGGIIIPTALVERANTRLALARLPELPHGEMKWGKVSNAKLTAYKRYVDCFFGAPEFTRSHFHCLVVDTRQLDHEGYNSGSKEIGFNRRYIKSRPSSRGYTARACFTFTQTTGTLIRRPTTFATS
jgi:hypothetical protein